ncbi:MAG TPA: hypothetical protein VHE37_05345, partial [Nevskiaceae bacterium]|nr:hypothetical protein [Nevskiaceae bacterium]
LIEDFVAGRGGLKGMGLRAGLKMLKAARPGIMDRATERMLPDFLEALDPLFQKFRKAGGKDFAAYLQQHEHEAVKALVHVADTKASDASPGVQSYYAKFRHGSENEVKALIPGLGRLVQHHLK